MRASDYSFRVGIFVFSDELRAGAVPPSVIAEFVADKLEGGFIGRLGVLAQIREFLGSRGGARKERVLLLTGEPGMGKSTVMCRIIESPNAETDEAATELDVPFPHDLVLPHFNFDKSIVYVIESYWLEGDALITAIRQRMIGHHICMASNAVTLSPIRFV